MERANCSVTKLGSDVSMRGYDTNVMTAQAQNQKISDDAKVELRQRTDSFSSLSKSQNNDSWIGQDPYHRTESVDTRSSSMNSSLHGSSNFCYQKEYQNDYIASEQIHYHSSPGLLPPPVKLCKSQSSKRKAEKLSFDCEICGENIKVDRRREWQYVVLRDCR